VFYSITLSSVRLYVVSVDVIGRQGRRRKQLLDDFKETRGYWKLKGEAIGRSLWRTRCGRVCVPVVRWTTGMNELVSVMNE
jgi:hypothetical protein